MSKLFGAVIVIAGVCFISLVGVLLEVHMQLNGLKFPSLFEGLLYKHYYITVGAFTVLAVQKPLKTVIYKIFKK
jgi:hypothetical protein